MNSVSYDRDRDRAHRPVPILVIGIAITLIAVGSTTVTAQTARADTFRVGGSELWIESKALLEPVTSFDFQEGAGGGRPERTMAPLSTALSQSGRLRTRFASPPTGDAQITVVRREIDGLWRLRVRGSSSLPFTRVDYDVIGANGDHGVLSHTSNDRSVIGVRVVERPPRRSDRPGGMGIVEGGVVLEMNLDQAVEAGHYAGSLRVTVIQL